MPHRDDGKPLNILIVDDDSIDRENLRRALLKRNTAFVLHEAQTAGEAAVKMEKESFDCIFIDYNLPDMDGISLLKKFYDGKTDLGIAPAVVLTGQDALAVMSEALRWGAQDYLVKDSISPETIALSVAKAREMYELKKSRKRAEDLLRQAQKMDAVGQLTSGIAHDFNNILTVILGNTRLMTRRLQGQEEMSRDDLSNKVKSIESAARSGADLIKQLMGFSRQGEASVELVDVNACLRDTCEMLRRALGEMIEIRLIEAAEGTWPVRTDMVQLQNAVINLAVNARDAMPRGGKLTVETYNVELDGEYACSHIDVKPGAYVMIAVSDTGAGMQQDIVQRIFEPFFTTKGPGEGTGLGLSMVYSFLRQGGGHIGCYSEPGHGTVFRLYLPRAVEEEEAAAPPKEAPTGTETILVVEDDEAVRMIAVSILEKLGYRTLEAPNGQEALRVLREEYMNIRLIFTDIVMPGGVGGTDLVRKAREYYPQIKALYTSGYTEHAIPDYQLVMEEQLISKPYRKETLAAKIRQVLDAPPANAAQGKKAAGA